MHKFWKWLFKLSKRKVKETHPHGADIKCSNCNTWYSVSGVEHEHKMSEWGDTTLTTCGQCGQIDHWRFDIAPVGIRCDEEGNPL